MKTGKTKKINKILRNKANNKKQTPKTELVRVYESTPPRGNEQLLSQLKEFDLI